MRWKYFHGKKNSTKIPLSREWHLVGRSPTCCRKNSDMTFLANTEIELRHDNMFFDVDIRTRPQGGCSVGMTTRWMPSLTDLLKRKIGPLR